MRKRGGLAVVAVAIVVGSAMAEIITLDDIDSPQIEDFEGIIGVTVPPGLFSGGMYGAPPANVPLPSGLTLTFPDPNPPTGTDFIIGDYLFDGGGGTYGLGGGSISSPADLHSGTAFAGAGEGGGFIYTFEFPVPVVDFGMFAATVTGQLTLTTFTPAGAQIESITFNTIPPPLTDLSFIGLGNTGPIGSFEIRSESYFVWDDVLWEKGPDTCSQACGNNGDKVLLCHVPPGNPGNEHTICIRPNAVDAHLAQHPGDHCGPCDRAVAAGLGDLPAMQVDVLSDLIEHGPQAVGVFINATPDRFGNGGGPAAFERFYVVGSVITLSTPKVVNGRRFLGWNVEGIGFNGWYTGTSLELPIIDGYTIEAVYAGPARW
ncbi:MAG: hypothetical protein IID41_00295 [Planctomycetes bacterium]|nr:hypothetical protein [Planctomycetota bacterium]